VGPSLVVLVEGQDDREVCRHLLDQHNLHLQGIKPGVLPYIGEITSAGGYTELIAAVPVQIKRDPDALAIVVDADIEIGPRWESLRSAVQNAGYSGLPVNPDPDGTIVIEEARPLVGIWIMPNNAAGGMIEDFVAALIPEDDILWPKVQQCVDSIPTEHRRFSVSKAKIHTWLAWQEEPGTRMGEAITKRYLDSESTHALRFVEWIRRMIELKPSFQTRPDVVA
jgi:hypothetical protein